MTPDSHPSHVRTVGSTGGVAGAGNNRSDRTSENNSIRNNRISGGGESDGGASSSDSDNMAKSRKYQCSVCDKVCVCAS